MPARAMWKGSLRIGREQLPVKLYSAVEEHGVHFRLLDARSQSKVQQQLVDPETDEIVPYQEARHGFPIADGYVLLDKKELEALAPKPSRTIALAGFLAADQLAPEWLIRPYYLGPDGEAGAYFGLAAALEAEGSVGIARWVMRNQAYTGALSAKDGYLLLTTLHSADEVAQALPAPSGRAQSDKEVKLAEQLITAYEDAFDPAEYRDEYRERVEQFVEQKAKGHKPRLKKPTTKREAGDLSAALAKSLAGAKKAKERKVA
ncbi:MAG TPA: Ku protein [Polyangiales bacterium]